MLYQDPALHIKRLNKLPLVMVMLLLTIVILLLFYVAYQRNQESRLSDDAISRDTTLQPATLLAENFIKEQTQQGALLSMEPVMQEVQKNTIVLPSIPLPSLKLKQQQLEEAFSSKTNLFSAEKIPVLDNKIEPANQGENFLNQSSPSYFLPHEVQTAQSPFEIKTGAVIPAVMITGINSDLPGQIIAQVSQPVYDTATGRHVLIPQGAKLIGLYDNRIAYGQQRVLIAWHRIVFPDASTLALDTMPGTDAAGQSGFFDSVDNHYLRIFGSAFMLSLISAGYQLSQPNSNDESDAQSIIGAALGIQMAQVGNEMVRRNLTIQPTLEIRPGYAFNVMVNKDMVFKKPY